MPRSRNRSTRRAQKKRRRERDKQARYDGNLQYMRGCPTPRKQAWDKYDEADEALGRTWDRMSPGRHKPVRVYLCDCGKYHLSSKPQRSATA